MLTSNIPSALQVYFEANRPIMLSGSPGIGKSCLVAQGAHAYLFGDTNDRITSKDLPDDKYIDIRASQFDAVDLRGLPIPDLDKNTTRWLTPDLFPTDPNWNGVILYDELPDAPPLVQSALYQLILDRRLGDYQLPRGARQIACGNRISDRAAAGRLSTALASRFGHLTIDVCLDGWNQWAINNDIAPEIIAFIRFRPELLHSFDPAKNVEYAFPCPRTWHILSDIYKNSARLPKAIRNEVFSGIIGNGGAAEFSAFVDVWEDLPNIDDTLADPDVANVPNESNVLYAVCGAIGRRINRENADSAFAYISRLPAEFQFMFVEDSTRRNPELCNTRAYIKWAQKNQKNLI